MMTYKHIHFIGIGGFGISALAKICHQRGLTVSGSDMQRSDNVQRLEKLGIDISVPHAAAAITPEVDLVIKTSGATTATPAGVEISRAQALGIPVEHREFLIDQLVQDKISLGIAGTHGKTTTSSLLTVALSELQADPSFLVGGIISQLDTNAHAGAGAYFVWEADEFADAFLGVTLDYGVLNNLEYDHPDYFKSWEDYENSFLQFANEQVKKLLFLNADDARLQQLRERITTPVITYGETEDTDYRFIGASPHEFEIQHNHASFTLKSELLGKHNLYNLTATFVLLHHLGFAGEQITESLSKFRGTERRMQKILENEHKLIISDYAHHPTAIATTLAGLTELELPITAVFEPHQYKRVQQLLPEFRNAFAAATEVIILPIFASRDPDTTIASEQELLEAIEHHDKKILSMEEAIEYMSAYRGEQRIFLGMSAGKLHDQLLQKFHASS